MFSPPIIHPTCLDLQLGVTNRHIINSKVISNFSIVNLYNINFTNEKKKINIWKMLNTCTIGFIPRMFTIRNVNCESSFGAPSAKSDGPQDRTVEKLFRNGKHAWFERAELIESFFAF